MTVKQKEFLKEFKDLLLKYNADIGWTCADCSDTYGLYDDHLYISMLGQKDIDLYHNSIDYNDLDELYKRAEMKIYDNYKQAYCMKETIGKDVEIKAVPRREYKPTKEQIAESKKRIELLGLEPRFSDKLYMSDRYYIREVKDGEMDLIRAINNFEKNYNAYVYHIIYTKSNFGNLYSMLYVSNNTEEWKADRKDLQNKECYAYVYNKSDEVCSEIGLIGVEKADTNLLTRTF